ncbi:MAG: hypothetical protein QM775_16040 [Pirellulales bacterium]
MAEDIATLAPKVLRSLLNETLFGAPKGWAFVINQGEPGFVTTLKSLTAAQVSQAPGPGRKPIVSHANHVLFGYELVNRAIGGDHSAFENADWNAAWKLEQVTEAEWADLLKRIEEHARKLFESAPLQVGNGEEIMLTGLFGVAAHNAYHLVQSVRFFAISARHSRLHRPGCIRPRCKSCVARLAGRYLPTLPRQ